MKKLMYMIGSSLLRKWLLSPHPVGQADSVPTKLKLNTEYISEVAWKYLMVSSASFLFTLFFAAGVTMAIFAIAQSFDVFGLFVPGAVFYSGIGLSVVSAIVVLACYLSLRNMEIDANKLYLEEKVPEAETSVNSPLEYLALLPPFLTGLMQGWKRESRAANEKQELPYAETAPKIHAV
jgi:hypothetical protein